MTTYAVDLDPLGVTVMVTHSKHMLWKAKVLDLGPGRLCDLDIGVKAKAYTFCDVMAMVLDQLHERERTLRAEQGER